MVACGYRQRSSCQPLGTRSGLPIWFQHTSSSSKYACRPRSAVQKTHFAHPDCIGAVQRSPARLAYTVMGNQVNLAYRLADLATGGQILESERTHLAAGDLVVPTETDQIQLEGVSRQIRMFEINER